jgi:hypothetical protein
MRVTFRVLLFAAVIAGLALGVSFGVGYAAGRGNPKQASGGLTQQQLNQMLGVQGAAAGAGTAGGAGGAGTASGTGRTNTGGAAGATALLRNPAGKITAVDGTTLTIETRAGSVQKVNLSPSTTVNKMSAGNQADLKVGDSVIAAGTPKPDGTSFDASSVSQVPAELAPLVDAGGSSGGGTAPSGR